MFHKLCMLVKSMFSHNKIRKISVTPQEITNIEDNYKNTNTNTNTIHIRRNMSICLVPKRDQLTTPINSIRISAVIDDLGEKKL